MQCPYCGSLKVNWTDDTEDFGVPRIVDMDCEECGAHYTVLCDGDAEEFIFSGGWTRPDYEAQG
jgi:hypothetical protein